LGISHHVQPRPRLGRLFEEVLICVDDSFVPIPLCLSVIYPTYMNSVPESCAHNNVPDLTRLIAKGHMTSGYAFPLEIFADPPSGAQK
jgi:hypothetical protein